MPKIFISYRRDDAAYPAHAIYDRLVVHFGTSSIVFDVDTIPLGIDFREYLNEAVGQCHVLLAVIGDRWLELRGADGRPRLHQANDFVRIEIQAALKRNIPVIPVLVGRASMPGKDELPRGLKSLSYRNAAELRPGRDFQNHLEQLVRGVQRLLKTGSAEEAQDPPKPERTVNPPVPSATQHQEPKAATMQQAARKATAAGQTGQTIATAIDMEFVLIPAGEFLMGSPDADESASSDEKPQHRVRITKPFYLGAHLVTQQQYERVVGKNPSHFSGDVRRPAESVSWFDAVAFCNRLSEQDGLSACYAIEGEQASVINGSGYCLPTEAEWEYACRAGTTTKWTFGDDPSDLDCYAWYAGNAKGTTHPVGQKAPNPWGVYDAYGNAWEWCWDWYGADYYKDSPDSDPTGPASGISRVLRGGSFYAYADYVRAAVRLNWLPVDRDDDIGFRVARTYP